MSLGQERAQAPDPSPDYSNLTARSLSTLLNSIVNIKYWTQLNNKWCTLSNIKCWTPFQQDSKQHYCLNSSMYCPTLGFNCVILLFDYCSKSILLTKSITSQSTHRFMTGFNTWRRFENWHWLYEIIWIWPFPWLEISQCRQLNVLLC